MSVSVLEAMQRRWLLAAAWWQRHTGERIEEQKQAEGEREGDSEVENEMVSTSSRERIRAAHVGSGKVEHGEV
jgi:hypothetical protein